ncbi:LrgB family protein [Silvimonas iriomotensis]|uniref:Membrane protein n=1 Tax=Silvimonas iriomotensis TaxID=449662 RepID=A0ABQ2PAC6_9NEIS|nr:LrgB family protein [Silvimonas iriomotensis]GGP21852.1 membrane protein [Silvimonas iriomotensis]
MSAWQSLQNFPATWLALTCAAFLLADYLYLKSGRFALLNPVLVGIVLVIVTLLALQVPYATYFAQAKLIHFLLAPATVALAIPLYINIQRMKAIAGPLLLAVAVGSVTGIASAVLLGRWLGLSMPVLLSFAPKSVTTPIAMALSARAGGLPSLTAGIVIVTGIIAAILLVPLLRWLRIDDDRIAGVAVGVAGHGIGTARAFQVSETAGAFAGLAMGLNGLLTSLLLPLLLAILL